MKLRNWSGWPDHFLRRAIAWVCREVGVRLRDVGEVRVHDLSAWTPWSGVAHERNHDVVVAIGPAETYPVPPDRRLWRHGVRDRLEGLVHTLAHEVAHVLQFVEPQARVTEHGACWHADEVLLAFRGDRVRLETAWAEEPVRRAAKPRPTRKQTNAARAAKNLAAWERKLKLAQTKCKKYRALVRRYEREGVL